MGDHNERGRLVRLDPPGDRDARIDRPSPGGVGQSPQAGGSSTGESHHAERPLAHVHRTLETAAAAARDRLELWSTVIDECRYASCAEIGVFRGDFARHVLQHCQHVQVYRLVDPWRHLDDWNKPSNASNDQFERIKADALARTEFAAAKRQVLVGKTTEISNRLPNEGLEFAYIDGDHTLRGITIDLVRLWPKMKHGGVLAGDDFCPSIWQHEANFEPTVVFPLAAYFAEAVGCTIYGLPYEQFAIVVDRTGTQEFEFRDLTGRYRSTALGKALSRPHWFSGRGGLRRLKRAIARPFGR